MTLFLLVTLGGLLIFILGALTGSGLNTRAQDARSRRQADAQRRINDERRELQEHDDYSYDGAEN